MSIRNLTCLAKGDYYCCSLQKKESKAYCKKKNLGVFLFLGFMMVMGGVMRKSFSRLGFELPFLKLETKDETV